MSKTGLTKFIGGKEVDVPVEEAWNAIVKVVRLARMSTQTMPDEPFFTERRSFLKERLEDLNGYNFFEIDAKEAKP